jgi:hypothetical protein
MSEEQIAWTKAFEHKRKELMQALVRRDFTEADRLKETIEEMERHARSRGWKLREHWDELTLALDGCVAARLNPPQLSALKWLLTACPHDILRVRLCIIPSVRSHAKERVNRSVATLRGHLAWATPKFQSRRSSYAIVWPRWALSIYALLSNAIARLECFEMLEDLKSVAVPLSTAAALTALGVLIAVAAGIAF